MDHQSSGVSFALIGHQDNWDKVIRFVNSLRITGKNSLLSLEKIKEVFGFIPPRKLFDIETWSPITGRVRGMYIETFISPDEIDAKHLHLNLKKVKEACDYAIGCGANIVSLGGFTSIVLESTATALQQSGVTYFTTGNSLTAAFIVKSIEKICVLRKQSLANSNLLIVGSTGDIGSACAQYFSGSVKQLLFCARQPGPLKKQKEIYEQKGISVNASIDINELLPNADIVICVASSLIEGANFDLLPPAAIICDAGYPKNISLPPSKLKGRIIFSGGMGSVKGGYEFTPDHKKDIYDFPGENIVHGCLLESMVLAMEQKPVAYSTGRGNISITAMNEIFNLCTKHEIEPAILCQN